MRYERLKDELDLAEKSIPRMNGFILNCDGFATYYVLEVRFCASLPSVVSR